MVDLAIATRDGQLAWNSPADGSVYCDMTPFAVVLVATLTSSVQARPDFSGRWKLDAPSPPPEAARVLVIEQPITRTNVHGEPVPPAYLYLTVRREGPLGTTTDTYTIGPGEE